MRGKTTGFEKLLAFIDFLSNGPYFPLIAIVFVHRHSFGKKDPPGKAKDFLITLGVPAAVFVPLFILFFWEITH
jgi:hypothetical protein